MFTRLAFAIDQQRVVLACFLPAIAIIPDQPFALAENDKVIGVGMNMAIARIGLELLLDRIMATRRAAFEHNQRFIAGPIGSGRNDAQIGEVLESREIIGRFG